MAFVYILQSIKSRQYYIGSTVDFENRLKEHNSGRVISTKNFRPWKVMLVREYASITLSKKIEYKIKKFKRKDYLEKMIREQDIKLDL